MSRPGGAGGRSGSEEGSSSGERPAGGLAAAIKEAALALGFDRVGITSPEPSEHLAFYRAWLEAGRHGEMGYLARPDAVVRRGDLTRTMASVRSVVVVADGYVVEDPPGVPEDPSLGVVARYARGADYHRVVKKKLAALLRRIPGIAGRPVAGRPYVDTGPVLERDLARRAGLGWFGKNTMTIHPRAGSYFFLGVLLLDLALPPDPPFEEDHCGTCRRCLDACPTGALLGRDASGAPVMEARRCISYLTIEHRGPIPAELRPLMGNRVYGCDICQEVCPFNGKFARNTTEPRYAARGPGERPVGVEAEERRGAEGGSPHPKRPDAPGATPWHPGTAAPHLLDLMRTALHAEAWEAFTRGSAIRRAGRSGLARNVAVALGNWGSPEAVPLLASALEDPDPLVRGHAAWALGRIASAEARRTLESALPSEGHPFVREEVELALGTDSVGI